MTLEEEILAMENEAAATVASTRAEAKILLSSVDRKKEQIAEEIAARLEREKAEIAEGCRMKLKSKLAEIEKEKQEKIRTIEKSAGRKSRDCAGAILKKLLGE
jgi:hypothetical protein